jgi:hypothetical protein
MMDATAVLLLARVILTPLAGAILVSVASTRDSPPALMVEGLTVNDASGGGGGSEPPGLSVTVWGVETKSWTAPDASV